MMFPITPSDLGVSLSRPTRYAGGAIGLWNTYKASSDPINFAVGTMTFGPIWSIDLATQVAAQTFGKKTAPSSRVVGPPAPSGTLR
jgi:hypothetical protein